MKIKHALLLLILFSLCGCQKKLICNLENSTFSSKAEITLSNDEVTDIILTNSYDSVEITKKTCGILSLTTKDLECKDKTIIIKKYQSTLDSTILTKDKIIEYFENNKYTCK